MEKQKIYHYGNWPDEPTLFQRMFMESLEKDKFQTVIIPKTRNVGWTEYVSRFTEEFLDAQDTRDHRPA